MHIPNDVARWLQETLLGLDKEDWGLGYMVDGILNSVPPDTHARWQLGVDTIYRILTSDLIAVHKFVECHDKASFFHAIWTLSPYESSGGFLWNGTLIYGTDRLSDLIDVYFRGRGERNDKPNPAFTQALEQVFAENGVPWSDEPLLPVTPDAGVEAASPR